MSEPILEPDLPICDPHHHLWDQPDRGRYLLPELLADAGAGHKVLSTVFVEALVFYRASGPAEMRVAGETEFVRGQAAMAASGVYGPVLACQGIVGFADLRLGAAVEAVLEEHIRAGGERFKGIRHAYAYVDDPGVRRSHAAPPAGLLGLASFREGFAKLGALGLSFDAWGYHPQIPEVASLADAFPAVPIVLDHVGGPVGIASYRDRRQEVFEGWRRDIRELAKRPNVFVKLGGLGMPLCGFDLHKRAERPGSEELARLWRPYIETCIEAFGPERGMFESNFPVDRASCDYVELWNAFKRITAGASASDKTLLYRDTARRFYRLE